MNEDPTVRTEPSERQRDDEAWREVGRQFEALGKSLSRAFRAAWERKETQQHVRSMQDGLEKMTRQLDQAVKKASEAGRAQRVRQEAARTADSLRDAGEKTWEDVRPQMLSGLRRVNAELQGLIDSLERRLADRPEESGAEVTQAEGERSDSRPKE